MELKTEWQEERNLDDCLLPLDYAHWPFENKMRFEEELLTILRGQEGKDDPDIYY